MSVSTHAQTGLDLNPLRTQTLSLDQAVPEFTPLQHETLRRIDHRIRDQRVEHAFAVGRDGEILGHQVGSEWEVDIRPLSSAIPGSIMVHNHPPSGDWEPSFSGPDIGILSMQPHGLVVFSPNYIYVITAEGPYDRWTQLDTVTHASFVTSYMLSEFVSLGKQPANTEQLSQEFPLVYSQTRVDPSHLTTVRASKGKGFTYRRVIRDAPGSWTGVVEEYGWTDQEREEFLSRQQQLPDDIHATLDQLLGQIEKEER